MSVAHLERPLQHPLIISSSSGELYSGTVLSQLLAEIVQDILQEPVLFEAIVNGLSNVLGTSVNILSFGSVNFVKTIKQMLQSRDVRILEDEEMAKVSTCIDGGAIAIVGMAARLPGSETLEEFWRVLEDGRDLHEKIRSDRFDVDTHYDPSGKLRNSTLTPYGVFIDRPGYFDTRLFNMSPREASQTDPQQRMMLLTTYEALEMAGYAPNRTPSSNTRRIGSFIGQTTDDWRANASQNIDTYFATGGIRAFGPGRLNYHFGWEGPSFSLDTACSSSAASIQLACSALLARECDTAVGGGVNLLTASDLFAGLSRGSFLSKTGGCKTFDHDADGYVRGDAVGVVVLKRLEDAIADRDNIQAVLRGAVTNHSAEAISITHPHAETQERLFTAVLEKAGVQAHDIDYVELHGTGTQAGDATESKSVTNVLARDRSSTNPLYIGTSKPNLGHSEAASGVTSIIKTILMLRKNMIPPHIGIKGRINQKLPPLKQLNTHISYGKTPFFPRPNGDGKRRILLNNFDAAGGNTSMLLEDPPILQIKGSDPRSHHVIATWGKTTHAILKNSQNLLEYLRQHPEARLEDISYTTTARRMHHVLRRSHAVSSVEGLTASLERVIADERWSKVSGAPPTVFVFTGQGSQYTSMASDLFKTNTSFREAVQDCDKLGVYHGFPSFLPIIMEKNMDISEATVVQIQLALVSIELAMASLWKSFGVIPSAVIGHSLGEYPALCIAGIISLSDCLYLVGERATMMESKCTPGSHSMLAVQESLEKVEHWINEFDISACEIACINGPTSTVVNGPVDDIRHLQRLLESRNIKATLLEVQFAFHSGQMDSILDNFATLAQKVQFSKPSVPVASTVLGSVVTTSGVIDAQYLKCQIRQPVQFTKALQALRSNSMVDSRTLWIETGPNPVCLGMVRSTIGEGVFLPSLKRSDGDWKVIASSVSEVYNAGIDIDWSEYHAPYEEALRLLELPTYSFDLKNYWIQYEGDWAIRKGSNLPIAAPANHAVPSFSTTSLHRIVSEVSNSTGLYVNFETDASETKLNRALRGHLVNGAGLCPSSVYADMAFTAASYIQNLSDSPSKMSMDVKDMAVHKPLLIQPGPTRQIIRVAATRKRSSDTVEVKFSSQDGTASQDHAHCTVAFGDGVEWKSDWARNAYLVKSRIDHLIGASERGSAHKILRPMVYKLFAALVDYDDKYQGLQEVYMDSHLLEATAKVKFRTVDTDGLFTHSPYWIDTLAHLSGFVLNGAETTPADSVYIAHGWDSMKIVGQLSAEKIYQSYVRMQETKTRGMMAGDVYLFEDDEVVAVCEDLRFQRIKRTMLDHLLPPTPADAVATTTPQRHPTKNRQHRQQRSPHTRQVAEAAAPFNFESVLTVIASEVGVEPSELSDDTQFSDLGVDSLLTIGISAKLSEQLGIDIPATLFVDCLSVKQLRSYLSGIIKATITSSSPAADRSDDLSGSDDLSSGEELSSNETSAAETQTSEQTSELDHSLDAEDPQSMETLRNIIASEIGVSPEELEDDTPLTEIGADSLLSVSILGAIKEQTGRVLPSSFLVENPTFAAIHRVLGGASQASPPQQPFEAPQKTARPSPDPMADSILLQGSSSSQEPCFFLLPDGSGSAGGYVGLPSLNTPGAVYGLNSPFLQTPASFTIPLQDVATMYMSEIRRVQPHGPYNLGGWSIGGSYAFEIASQLIRLHGEEINSLVLIDSPCPKTLPPLPIETIDLLEAIGAFNGLKDERAPSSSKTAVREDLRDHFAGSLSALRQYQPIAIPESKAPKSVTALWARNGVWETVGEKTRSKFESKAAHGNLAEDWMMDPRSSYETNGWEALLPGATFTCDVVSGDHFSIMRRPGVLDLGAKLSKAVLR
ncbi:MAG: hypothetical protein M1819_001083 [Sarea resinae]|nr:MAG: hypothetical protein M1819_001083 [Sarea resinae]